MDTSKGGANPVNEEAPPSQRVSAGRPHNTVPYHAWKAIILGLNKVVYRLDGVCKEMPQHTILTVRDPRDPYTRFRKPEPLDLPIPSFVLDNNTVGVLSKREVAIYSPNDNINEAFLRAMCEKVGAVSEVLIYRHPVSKKHLEMALVVFEEHKDASLFIDKNNGCSVMGNVITCSLDPYATKISKRYQQLTRERAPKPQYLNTVDDRKLSELRQQIDPLSFDEAMHVNEPSCSGLDTMVDKLHRSIRAPSYTPSESTPLAARDSTDVVNACSTTPKTPPPLEPTPGTPSSCPAPPVPPSHILRSTIPFPPPHLFGLTPAPVPPSPLPVQSVFLSSLSATSTPLVTPPPPPPPESVPIWPAAPSMLMRSRVASLSTTPAPPPPPVMPDFSRTVPSPRTPDHPHMDPKPLKKSGGQERKVGKESKMRKRPSNLRIDSRHDDDASEVSGSIARQVHKRRHGTCSSSSVSSSEQDSATEPESDLSAFQRKGHDSKDKRRRYNEEIVEEEVVIRTVDELKERKEAGGSRSHGESWELVQEVERYQRIRRYKRRRSDGESSSETKYGKTEAGEQGDVDLPDLESVSSEEDSHRKRRHQSKNRRGAGAVNCPEKGTQRIGAERPQRLTIPLIQHAGLGRGKLLEGRSHRWSSTSASEDSFSDTDEPQARTLRASKRESWSAQQEQVTASLTKQPRPSPVKSEVNGGGDEPEDAESIERHKKEEETRRLEALAQEKIRIEQEQMTAKERELRRRELERKAEVDRKIALAGLYEDAIIERLMQDSVSVLTKDETRKLGLVMVEKLDALSLEAKTRTCADQADLTKMADADPKTTPTKSPGTSPPKSLLTPSSKNSLNDLVRKVAAQSKAEMSAVFGPDAAAKLGSNLLFQGFGAMRNMPSFKKKVVKPASMSKRDGSTDSSKSGSMARSDTASRPPTASLDHRSPSPISTPRSTSGKRSVSKMSSRSGYESRSRSISRSGSESSVSGYRSVARLLQDKHSSVFTAQSDNGDVVMLSSDNESEPDERASALDSEMDVGSESKDVPDSADATRTPAEVEPSPVPEIEETALHRSASAPDVAHRDAQPCTPPPIPVKETYESKTADVANEKSSVSEYDVFRNDHCYFKDNESVSPEAEGVNSERDDSDFEDLTETTFDARTPQQAEEALYAFRRDGLDKEDLMCLEKTFHQMQNDGTANWSRNLFWVPPCDVPVVKQLAKPKRIGKTELFYDDPELLGIVPHSTGCARTQGYYRLSNKQKRGIIRRPEGFQDRTEISEMDETTVRHIVQATREARSDNRRLLSSMRDANSNFFKNNQLKYRKKMIKFARSRIHGWGLYALEMIAPGEMIVEYVGQMVRPTVADVREQRYTRKGMGSSYLFRIDSDRVIDATQMGNFARFINHSCQPDCYAKVVVVDGEKRIVIYSKTVIRKGDEITYDYKFPIEEDDKIDCLCGAPGCRGFLN